MDFKSISGCFIRLRQQLDGLLPGRVKITDFKQQTDADLSKEVFQVHFSQWQFPEGRLKRKIIMQLKLTFFLLVAFCLQVHASGHAQVTINARQEAIPHVFKQIENQTGYGFLFNYELIQRAGRCSVFLKDASLIKAIEATIGGKGLTYSIHGKTIIIKKAILPEEAIPAPAPEFEVITGKVADETGAPLAGVSVMIKGTKTGVVTDQTGAFKINAAAENTLVFEMVGYQSTEVVVAGKHSIFVRLKAIAGTLDQIIVVGYGVQKKGDLTAAISSVDGASLEKMATSNPIDAMQGKVAGLTVTRTGGNPGEMADIRIRGIGTFGNHQPLFIIDGIPGDPYFLSNGDIASIEVLKDGAAAAIYGSRAANGVILITTKNGKKGAPVIDANVYYGWVSPTKRYDLLDATGYKKVHQMMYENADIDPEDWPAYITKASTINTDWQDEIAQQGVSQNYNASIRGGGDYVNYSLSGNLTDDKGTMIGSGFNKKSVLSKTNIKKGRFDINLNLSYAETKNEAYKFTLRDAYYQSPLLPVYDSSEQYGYALKRDQLPTFMNVVGADHFEQAYTTTKYFVGNVSMKLNLFKGLDYTANLGYRNSNEFAFSYYPPHWVNYNDPPSLYPYVSNVRTEWKERTMEHLLHYQTSLGRHHLKILAGATATSQTSEWLSGTAEGKTVVHTTDEDGNPIDVVVPAGFPDPHFTTIDAGKGGTFSAGGSRYTYNRTSLLGRINYDFADKYLFQVSVRRDGSSKFGPDNRYGTFPSAALGWKISSEPFLKPLTWISNLKLRASYGKLGNEGALSYYEHQALIVTSNSRSGGYVQGTGRNTWPGAIARDLENRLLQWETVNSANFGLDFSLLDNSLSGTLNYFHNHTSGLLIYKEEPPSAGVNNPILNVGEMLNTGLELELTYSNHRRKVQMDITGTASMLHNKVLKLANDGQILYGTDLKSDHIPTQTRVGRPVGSFFLYQADGIFQSAEQVAQWNQAHPGLQPAAAPGDIRFLDINGDNVLDEQDKIYSGSGMPKLEYGMNLNLRYSNFDLSMFLQGVTGGKIYNGNRFELEGMDVGRNFLKTTASAWQQSSPSTTMPRAVLGDPNQNNRASTRFLEDGGYLRGKTLQLGYSLPKKQCEKLGLERCRIYLSGQNLWTITGYSGLDPEVGMTDVLNTGVDRMLYPQTKTILVGLQLSL